MKLAPFLALALAACSAMHDSSTPAVSSRWFGTAKNGRPAKLWTLKCRDLEIDVTDFGATLVAVRTPDGTGRVDDVVLGFADVSGYESGDNQYFGCTTGRVCNRIAKGTFVLDGYTYHLAVNNGPNHLHGGTTRSLDKVFWDAQVVGDATTPGVRFTYRSPDGEEGYPGNLDVSVTYWLVPVPGPVSLQIAYEARTDRRTPVNLTNHAYWNLAGAGAASVLDHELTIDADGYTPTDDTLIPIGNVASVDGTALDFRQPRPIGLRLDAVASTPAMGYDHNFVLRPGSDGRIAAKLRDPHSGRWMTIRTSEPALQFYSGNWLRGQIGKGGRSYAQRSAVCLETQHYPDSVNRPMFPNTILEPGQTYSSRTLMTFGTD
ncbi:MAG: galactose mutarotase [Planctomycetes bacterium]|nr:galactose mutarotase [Planctomycetota bacterium]